MARVSKTGSKNSKAKASRAVLAKSRKTAKAKSVKAKITRNKTTRNERRIVPVSTRRNPRSISDLTKELNQARAQQTASAEVLKIISSSTGELGPVFQAILKNAIGICEAQ